MATQTVIGNGPPAIAGGSLQLRAAGTDALVASASATETASGSTIYTAAFTDVAAGTYRCKFVDSGGTVRYVQWVTLTLTTATFVCYEMPLSDVSALQTDIDDIQTTVDAIAAATTGGRLQTVGAVSPGGTIRLFAGSDYLAAIDSDLTRTVSDIGGALHALLTAGDLDELLFGARPSAGASVQITGTITAVSYASNVTTITIEIDQDNIPHGPYHDGWIYHIDRTDGDGNVSPPLVEGCLELHWKST